MARTNPASAKQEPGVRSPQEHLAAMRLHELPEMLAAREVTERLGISRQVIHRLVEGGELSAIRIGKRSLRIFRSSLIDYVERQLTREQQRE